MKRLLVLLGVVAPALAPEPCPCSDLRRELELLQVGVGALRAFGHEADASSLEAEMLELARVVKHHESGALSSADLVAFGRVRPSRLVRLS